MAGRKPKPTALKQLEGNPGKRPLNTNEPQFSGTPACPKHLDKEAKREWKRLADTLSEQSLLTTADRAAFAAYCSAWSRWINAEEQVQKFGAVIKSPKSGFPIQNPYVGVANTALDQMRKFAIEFGMTPSSRSRISIADGSDKGEDAFDTFMKGIGAMEPDGNSDITDNIPQDIRRQST